MVDWVSLLRSSDGVREDGIYTCVGPGETPQRTRVADVVTALAAGVVPTMPARAGWWEVDRADAQPVAFAPWAQAAAR
jgi:hypothetical protein